jgi:hypothetical protein
MDRRSPATRPRPRPELKSLPRVDASTHRILIGLRRLQMALAALNGEEPKRPPSLREVLGEALREQHRLQRLRLKRAVPGVGTVVAPHDLRQLVQTVLRETDSRRKQRENEGVRIQMHPADNGQPAKRHTVPFRRYETSPASFVNDDLPEHLRADPP